MPHPRATRLSTAIIIAVVGIMLTISALFVTENQRKVRTERWLEAQGRQLRASIEEALGDTISDLTALAALIEAVDGDLTPSTFTNFGRRIELNPSMIAVGYVVEVPDHELATFVDEMRDIIPGYRVTETVDDQIVPVTAREVHYPVKFFLPGHYLELAQQRDPDLNIEDGLGFDAASEPGWITSLEEAESSGDVGISDFAPLGELSLGKTFTIFVPVFDGPEIAGFVGGAAVDVLLSPDSGATEGLEWQLQPVASGEAEPGSWASPLDVDRVPWEVVVTLTPEMRGQLAGIPPWIVIVIGLAVTVLLVAFVDQLVQRARTKRRISALQRAADDKDRFLAVISHEIRTPLTAITGFAYELDRKGKSFSAEERSELLGLLATQSEEVAGLIEDLLVASRSNLSSIPVDAEVVRLREEAQQALPVTDHEIDFLPSESMALADPRRVRQIARNLITNAIRHGGPRISVRAESAAGRATLTVADDGPPIPPERVSMMFEAYHSAAGDRRSVDSIGLGLYVSRTLAGLMGGDLVYRHEQGESRFILDLPGAGTTPADALPPMASTRTRRQSAPSRAPADS